MGDRQGVRYPDRRFQADFPSPVDHLNSNIEGRLLLMLADGAFHSGTRLGQALGMGRAGVARVIGRLEQAGLTVDAVRGRGYRVPGGYEPLDRDALCHRLAQGGGQNAQVRCEFRPDSTNEIALAQPIASSPVVVLAEGQAAGRGRIGRTWQSPLGGVYASLARDFSVLPESPAPLALGIGVQLALALRQLGWAVHVKWPNDLLLNGAKVGGILSELRGEPLGPCRMVIGVGLNRACPGDVRTSAAEMSAGALTPGAMTGGSRNDLAALVSGVLVSASARFQKAGLAPLLDGWDQCDALMGRQVALVRGDERVVGRVLGIDGMGRLRLNTDRGIVAFSSGEAHLERGIAP